MNRVIAFSHLSSVVTLVHFQRRLSDNVWLDVCHCHTLETSQPSEVAVNAAVHCGDRIDPEMASRIFGEREWS